MIINKIKHMGEELYMLDGHDRLQYLVDKPLTKDIKMKKECKCKECKCNKQR